VIQEPVAFGTEGELIIPVIKFGDKGAVPIAFPADCPTPGGSPPLPDPAPPTITSSS
jgi:hypothetical protein